MRAEMITKLIPKLCLQVKKGSLLFPSSFSLYLSSCVEWRSKDHGGLHVHVSEHSPFIELTSHVKLAHVLDSLVCVAR